jgi:hypothetical protein
MTPFGLKTKTIRFFFGVPDEAAQPKLGKAKRKLAAAALTPVLTRNSRLDAILFWFMVILFLDGAIALALMRGFFASWANFRRANLVGDKFW